MSRKRKTNKKQKPTARVDSGSRFGWLNVLLLLIIIVGVGVLLFPPTTAEETPTSVVTQDVPAPPKIQLMSMDGVEVASVDPAAFDAWCKEVGLPSPPVVVHLDPIIVRRCVEAFHKAAEKPTAANLGRAGQISESLEAHDTAAALLRRAADLDEDAFRWPYLVGSIAQSKGELDQANKWLTRAKSLNTNHAMLFARLGQVRLDNGDLPAAKASFEEYNRLDPKGVFGHVGLARIALLENQTQAALRHLQRAMRITTQDFQVHYMLGETLARLGRREEAARYFKACESLPSGARFDAADALFREMDEISGSIEVIVAELRRIQQSSQYERMAELIETIIQRRPGDMVMICNLADVYRKLGRVEDAHRLLDGAERDYGILPRIHRTRATIFLAEHEYQRAADESARAIEQDPNDARALDMRGRALMLLGQFPEAEDAMRRSIELDSSDITRYYLLCDIILGQKRIDEARECVQDLLRKRPGDDKLRKQLETLNRMQ